MRLLWVVYCSLHSYLCKKNVILLLNNGFFLELQKFKIENICQVDRPHILLEWYPKWGWMIAISITHFSLGTWLIINMYLYFFWIIHKSWITQLDLWDWPILSKANMTCVIGQPAYRVLTNLLFKAKFNILWPICQSLFLTLKSSSTSAICSLPNPGPIYKTD